jgi:hypothetical protein
MTVHDLAQESSNALIKHFHSSNTTHTDDLLAYSNERFLVLDYTLSELLAVVAAA